jgi:hypothetical protein
MKRAQIYAMVAMLFSFRFLAAQRVLYSPVIDDRYTSHFEVAGKTSDYYWVLKQKEKTSGSLSVLQQEFEVYDARLDLVNTVFRFIIPENTLKEYLVAGTHFFDRLLVLKEDSKTIISLQRFSEDGSSVSGQKTIFSFPFNERGNSFLLIRSEDKRRMLLLCFESVTESSPKLHAILFNENWEQLFYKTYHHPNITQPMIQDDFTSYPVEHFNSYPVQLANNGQWLMASPSRTSNNFLLLHFCDDDNSFSYKELKLPPYSQLDDVVLSIDNNKGEAFAGVLSKFHYPSLKNVQVAHYSMIKQQFDFDSSYRFSTLAGNKFKNDHIVHESFAAVPGNGFLLLKEYGKEYSSAFESDDAWNPEVFLAAAQVANVFTTVSLNSDGYARFNELVSAGNTSHRGDLSLFYFPGQRKDSCWSGFISKEQTTDMNSPYLSYLFIPSKDKLALMYNSPYKNGDQYGASTFLDTQGNALNEGGLVFWRFSAQLNFQEAKQIASDEVAVPYKHNQRNGFAIIRF